jgi:hypothetical protein
LQLGVTKFGNKAKQIKCSKKCYISYQFMAGVEMYGHGPRYAADDSSRD